MNNIHQKYEYSPLEHLLAKPTHKQIHNRFIHWGCYPVFIDQLLEASYRITELYYRE